jgi:hypothetical protein
MGAFFMQINLRRYTIMAFTDDPYGRIRTPSLPKPPKPPAPKPPAIPNYSYSPSTAYISNINAPLKSTPSESNPPKPPAQKPPTSYPKTTTSSAPKPTTTAPNITTQNDFGNSITAAPVTSNPTPAADPNSDLTKALLAMFQSQQQQQVPSIDLAALKSGINNRFNSVKGSLMAKIEAAKNKALAGFGGLSDRAIQGSQGELETNNADLAQSLRRVFEGSEAAGGYRGGMSVQGQIDANTTAQANANAIRQNKTNTLNDIAREIELVNKDAEQSKIAAEADTEAQLQQALIDAEQFGANYDLDRAGLDLQNRQFDFSRGIQEGQLTGTYNGQDTLAKQQFDAEQAWNEWNKQWQIENEAWQRNPDNPQVLAQILQNKAQLLNNQLAELELKNYPEEQRLKIQEYKKRIAEIGAAPAMSQYDIDIKKAQLDQIKAETENIRNPAPAQPNQSEASNYYTSSALNELQKLPDVQSRKAWLNQHAAEIIQNAGTSAYSFLLEQADPNGIYNYNN